MKSDRKAVVIAISILTAMALIFGSILLYMGQTSGSYAAAKQFLHGNETVNQYLGTIEKIYLVNFEEHRLYSSDLEEGDASLTCLVIGSKAYHLVDFEMKLTDKKWMITRASFNKEDRTVNLLLGAHD